MAKKKASILQTSFAEDCQADKVEEARAAMIAAGTESDKDLPTAVEAALNKAGEAAQQQSFPGISYSESDPGDQTHTRWYYGFRIARALIISGTIIYTIHRGLFEFLAWVFTKR